MASGTTTDVNCGPCLYNNITVPGNVWCLSCEEGLCQSCADSHQGIKATRNHKVIPVEKCHHVASIGHLMSQTCKNHNKALDLYCPSHDAPVCSLCISENHRECKDIVSLDDVAKNVVSSSSFCNLEQNVGNLFKNLSQLKAERERNSKQLQSDKIAKNTSVKEMRRKLNELLDTLEEKLLQELSSKTGTCETEINNSLFEIELKTKAVYAIQSNISQLKEMATDVQFFLAIREIDKSVTTETNWLHAIANQRNMEELTLDLKTKPMEDLLETKSLGSVKIDRSRNTVPINHLGMKEAQIPLEAMRNKIDRIRLQQKIYIPLPITNMLVENLFGCMICSDGNIIFADGPSRTIKVFNKKGNHIKDVRVPGTPSDITEISQGRIAVTY
ncbi:tripartite motif-containing protein 75-like isoform X2 [Mytilus californianus]|nr:tripartite motif-containing protein 75-like isoform X2 [Mytilus californianus]